MNNQVTEPRTAHEFKIYYRLRWEILRKPWNQPEGSELDELDGDAVHAMIVDDKGEAVAVGRLHFHTPEEAQVRFMAVRADRQGRGLGKQVLEFLEGKAREGGAARVVLQARDKAVDFYLRNGYIVAEKTFLLFDDVQHYRMKKDL